MTAKRVLIVIPCLNEAAHIGELIEQFEPLTFRLRARIVVADGGSSDGSPSIVQRIAVRNNRVSLIYNPKRLQSAGVNLAVEQFGADMDYLIRIDAHGGYPDEYCERLIEEAEETGADAVVVSMQTTGNGLLQKAAAAAQNSRLGTGGSRHRHASQGAWVDHGHHALMRVAAFEAVGGYDESFSHNEDAELDHRLRAARYRIWLSGKTSMTYFPRNSLGGLFRQYLGYGKGRARNLLKHRAVPKVRQMIPLLVAPVVGLALLSVIHWAAALPFLAWAAICLGYGALIALREREPALALAGLSAMVMHFAWSLGFWVQLIGGPRVGSA